MRTWMRVARFRVGFLIAFATFLFAIVELRLFSFQVLGARALDRSPMHRRFVVTESGRRGDLLDARGGALAASVEEVDVRVWTEGVRAPPHPDAAAVAGALERIAGVAAEATLQALSKRRRWELLATGLRDPRAIAELRELIKRPAFRALSLEVRWVRDESRIDPRLSPLLGWTGWIEDPDGDAGGGRVVGVAGLEAELEHVLAPSSGGFEVGRDGRQRDLIEAPHATRLEARDGRNVRLSLEPLAQAIAEEEIDAAVAEFSPVWAQIVVADPRSGHVLASSQRPAPASARPSGESEGPDPHLFLPAHRVYPPGSSFKPFMLGLVLERGAATAGELVDCEDGHARFGGRVIQDSHPSSWLTVSDVLVQSSNIGMAKLALRLVPEPARKGDACFEPILAHLRRLGFGRRVAGLTGEENGLVPSLRDMDRNYSLASLSFGQQIAVTALQMTAAASAIANGGTWRAPRFVRTVERSTEGGTEPAAAADATSAPADGTRVFSPAVAAELKAMLTRVADEGGARGHRRRGWSMAGKTGTAEDEKDRSRSIASFWGFAPVNDPRFLVLVVLREPGRGRFAAENAAPIACAALGRLLERYEVPFDRPEELAGSDPGGSHSRLAPDPGERARTAALVASPSVGEDR